MSLPVISPLLNADSPVNDTTLQMVALVPTAHLEKVADKGFLTKLTDKDFLRIAVLLAKKGYDEGGCAIGGVVVDNATGLILGKGHNRHVQESRVYWHGETDAINDAGTRVDFSKTTLYTTLTPCRVCTALTLAQGFSRLVIGNDLDGVNRKNEEALRAEGVTVDIIPDAMGLALYADYAKEKPAQDTRDWQGQAGVVRAGLTGCC